MSDIQPIRAEDRKRQILVVVIGLLTAVVMLFWLLGLGYLAYTVVIAVLNWST